jgi:polysaccharide deacetylase family protein (PEP-CTERM system associated)
VDNAIVVDLEHWHSSEFLTPYLPDEKPDQVVEATRPILDLLDRYDVRATFAVLGSVAQNHPVLVREIYDKGHEIACHAYSHKTLFELGKAAFDDEIQRSIALLRSITGESPKGFRAPSFSMDNSTKWAFEVLEKYGFEYDASVFPVKTMLYGMPDAPLHIYRPSKDDVARHDPQGKILEFPMTVLKAYKNLPIAGGFYLRALPLWFLRAGFRQVNRTRPSILYIHPWETYPGTPRLDIPAFSRFVTYYGIGHALRKFEVLLKEFRFRPIREVLSGQYDR